MSQIKEFVHNINKGKNLDENIPLYKNMLSDVYNQASLLYITMEYYVLYELLQEKKGEENAYLQEVIGVVNQVVSTAFSEERLRDEKRQELLELLRTTRTDVIGKMKILTMYTDKLSIYEHVINRIELKYGAEIATADVDVFVQKVCQYIFSGKDNVVINESIKEVLAELPVRMARSKYFQLIEDSLSVYKGSDKSAVDRYIYMLETSAMLYEPEGADQYFVEIKEFTERLDKMYFSALSEPEFHMVCEELQEKATFISEVADFYVSIQSVLNHLYCYLSSLNRQDFTDTSDVACVDIIRGVSSLFAEGSWKEIPEEISDKLVQTEGKLEKLAENLLQLESVLMDVCIGKKEKLEELGLATDFRKLEVVSQLISVSGTFVEFEEEKQDEMADETYILEQTGKLLAKLKEQFSQNEICITRAVIAATISKFPVFFTSSEEVEEYVRESLERCTDDAERQASMNVIASIMEDNR